VAIGVPVVVALIKGRTLGIVALSVLVALSLVYLAFASSLQRRNHAERCESLGRQIEELLEERSKNRPRPRAESGGTKAWQSALRIGAQSNASRHDEATIRFYEGAYGADVLRLAGELRTPVEAHASEVAALAPPQTLDDLAGITKTLKRMGERLA